MKSKVLLASILLLTIALAGCAGDEAPAGETGTGSEGDAGANGTNGTAGGNNGTTGNNGGTTNGNTGSNTGEENKTNTAPVASLVASAVNGTAPLNVTFTLDGSDADGDNLAWTLSINGTEIASGDGLPADVSHVFGAGDHAVNLTVSDGALADAAVLAINVVAGDPNAGLPAPQTISGANAYPVGVLGLCGTGFPSFGPEIWGWKYSIEPASHIPTWWNGDNDPIDGGATGTVPANKNEVGACPGDDVAPSSSWTITVWHPDYVL